MAATSIPLVEPTGTGAGGLDRIVRPDLALDDRYDATEGVVLLSGIQALVRAAFDTKPSTGALLKLGASNGRNYGEWRIRNTVAPPDTRSIDRYNDCRREQRTRSPWLVAGGRRLATCRETAALLER